MHLEAEQSVAGTAGRWPDAVAYREAIQNPGIALSDPQLSEAGVHVDKQGLPLAYTGRFAVVFRLRDATGRSWALRCFTTPQEPTQLPRSLRYHLVLPHVQRLPELLVPARYLERGIRVGARYYPAVAMPWAPGMPVGRWVEQNRQDASALRRLAAALTQAREALEEAGLAHGDWQHDNLLIAEGGRKVRLVDYDGLFVPELAGQAASESGHANYQHPRRSALHFGVGLDRFACLAMRTALLGLARDPTLWERHGDGESLLFVRADFLDPEHSALFAALRSLAELDGDEELAEGVARLATACRAEDGAGLLPEPTTGPAPTLALPPEEARAEPAEGRWWSPVGAAPRLATAPQEESLYLARLNDPALREAERRHLRLHRVLLLAALALLVWRVAGALSGSWLDQLGVLTPALWLALALCGGFADWPRRRAYSDLQDQAGQMVRLVAERREQIAAWQRKLSPDALHAMQTTLADYVAQKMGRIPINRAVADGVTGVNEAVLELLRQDGVQSALDLARRTTVAQVPPHQVMALLAWCRRRESEFADDYRRDVAHSRGAAASIQRLEWEIAEFEREAGRLRREGERFPAVSLRAYLRRLIGRPG